MLHLAEVAPAGGAVVALEALPYLFALALLYFALGGIKAVVYFVDFVIWIIRKTVGHIPFAGGAIEGLAKRGAAKLTNALGHAESGIDQYIGFCWHNLAHVVRWTLRVMEHLAHQITVNALAASLHISRKHAAQLIQALLHPIRTYQHVLRRFHRLEHAALHLLRHIVLEGVYPRIRAGEAALDHVIERDIPRLRARERALEKRVGREFNWIKAHPRSALSLAFAGAVSWAIAKFGGHWIFCRNWKRLGKHVCGLPFNLIEDLLGLALAFGVLIDPEETAHLAVDAVDFVEPLVGRMLGATAATERDAEAALAGLLS